MAQIIAPSTLAADFLRLGEEIEMINSSNADWIHLDIMDGVFVPNLSFGFPVLEKVAKIAKKPLDAHLMIIEPEKFIPRLKDLGVYMINVHYEACPHLHRTIQKIKNEGIKAGVTINPHTPVTILKDILCDVDMVLVMSVNPGFGAQKFIPKTLDKIRELRQLIENENSNAIIEVDGGVNFETAPLLAQAGTDVLVSGSFIFADKNPLGVIDRLKSY